MALGDIGKIKNGATTSARELQEFVATLKGRSPAEAMGLVARSHLLQAMVISLVLQVVLVLGFTFYSIFTAPAEAAKGPVVIDTTTRPTPATGPATTAAATAPAASVPASVPRAAATTTGPSPEVIKKVMSTEAITPEKQKSAPDLDFDKLR